MLFDRLAVRIGDRTAVERSERQCKPQRIDQESHADGRAAGDDGEGDAAVFELAHRACGLVGDDLVLGQQRAVDIGNHKRDAGHEAVLPGVARPIGGRASLPTISSTILSTGASIDTMTGFSSGVGRSSVLNWLGSRSGGMKWPVRLASRLAIKCCDPSRKTIRTSLRPCTRISR